MAYGRSAQPKLAIEVLAICLIFDNGSAHFFIFLCICQIAFWKVLFYVFSGVNLLTFEIDFAASSLSGDVSSATTRKYLL